MIPMAPPSISPPAAGRAVSTGTATGDGFEVALNDALEGSGRSELPAEAAVSGGHEDVAGAENANPVAPSVVDALVVPTAGGSPAQPVVEAEAGAQQVVEAEAGAQTLTGASSTSEVSSVSLPDPPPPVDPLPVENPPPPEPAITSPAPVLSGAPEEGGEVPATVAAVSGRKAAAQAGTPLTTPGDSLSPSPVDAAATSPSVPSTPVETAESPHAAQIGGSASARFVDRVEQIVEQLQRAGPPKTMVVDLAEFNGMRITVSLRGGTVHLSFATATPDNVGGWVSELEQALSDRGLKMADDGRGGRNSNQSQPERSLGDRRGRGRQAWPGEMQGSK